VLERQRDQVSKAAAWERVLVWKKPIIGLHAELVAAGHRFGDEIQPERGET
jgi:hypothetical protein